MKRIIIFILLIPILVVLLFFSRTLFHNFGTIEANEVTIGNGLISDAKGSPINGIIFGKINHLEEILDPFLELISYNTDWEKLSFGKKFSIQDLENMKEDLEGFSVHMNVENGKISKKTNLYYDLRKSKDKVFGISIPKNLKYYLGYLFSNQIKLADVEFENNQLNGDATVYSLGSSSALSENIQVSFENNLLSSLKRYYKNGSIKRINNFENLVKHGLQKEFHRDGALKYEGNYKQGKKEWEKSYFWTMNKIRKHVTVNDSNLVTEKHYFPNGKLAKNYNPSDRTEWFSNGDIAYYRGQDSTYNGVRKGKIETFHNSGALSKVYNYNEVGKLNGPYEINYSSGKTWEEGNFKDGRKHGNLKKWYNNGQLAEDHLMDNGRIDGPYFRYYDNGVMWKEFNYENGSLNGKYKKWWNNGKLAFDCDYKNNRTTRCEKWNDKGEVIK